MNFACEIKENNNQIQLQKMKTRVFLMVLLFSSHLLDAQSTENQMRLSALQNEINLAVKAEDYLKAAELSHEREIREEIEKAVVNEDYQRAAELFDNLNNTSSVKSNELEKRLEEALAVEDYRLAQQIQNEIDGIMPSDAQLGNPGVTPDYKEKLHQPVYREDYYYQSDQKGDALYSEIPEFTYQVYARQTDGSLNSLEKITGQMKTSGGGYGGFSGRRTSYVLAGGQSRIGLKRDDLNFVIRVDPGVDPSDEIQLLKLDSDRRNRYAHVSEGRTFVYGSSYNQVTDNLVSISFRSLGNDVFSIEIHNKLLPGQYAFKRGDKFYAFSVI